jgi:hypothetical protein
VTSVGSNVFHACSNLTVHCAAATESSGWDAAWNTGNRPVFWNGVRYSVSGTGATAVEYDGATPAVVIPNVVRINGVNKTVTNINFGVFDGSDSLTSLSLPFVGSALTSNSAATFGNAYFGYIFGAPNYGGQNAYIPVSLATVTVTGGGSIRGNAFAGCTSLTSITILSGVTSIGTNAFYNCTSLASIAIPSSVTGIGENAFYHCTSLASITIPSGVTNIGANAFYNCTSLASITIPSSVTRIGAEAFSGTAWYNNQANGMVYAGKVLYLYKGTMPANTTIGNILPDTVAVSDSTFSGCTGLTSITIPSSVTSIGSGAFSGCTGLTAITIPSDVTSIGSFAFSGCTGLTGITIPNSVTSLGNEVFSGCTSLQAVTVAAGNTHYSVLDGVLYNANRTALLKYPQAKTGDTFFIPASVASIAAGAFEGCTSLTTVWIGNFSTLVTLGANAFPGGVTGRRVYVPGYLVTPYKNAANWSTLSADIKKHETAVTLCTGDDCTEEAPCGEEDCCGTVSVAYGNVRNLPVLQKLGYTFIGWKTGDGDRVFYRYDTNGTQYWDITDAAIKLYPIYVLHTLYVFFETEGGAMPYTHLSFNIEDGVTLPEPVNPGYDFAGWYALDAYDGTVLGLVDEEDEEYNLEAYFEDYAVCFALTLAASWTPKTFTVTLYLNGGTADETQVTVTYDEAYTLLETAPVRAGYTFDGWRHAMQGYLTGADGVGYDVWTICFDTTVLAEWLDANEDAAEDGEDVLYLAFFPNGPPSGGMPSMLKPVVYNQPVGMLPLPQRLDYWFLYWHDVNGVIYTADTVMTATANVALTAEWTPVVYTISLRYVSAGGSGVDYIFEYTIEDEIEFWYTGFYVIVQVSGSMVWNGGVTGDFFYTPQWSGYTFLGYYYYEYGTGYGAIFYGASALTGNILLATNWRYGT